MSDELATEYADSIAGDIRRKTANGHPFGPEEGDSAYDYLEGVLDVIYKVSGDGSYRGAEVLIAFGGPTAWIDTLTYELRVSWWSGPVRRELPQEFCDALDEALSELWECR